MPAKRLIEAISFNGSVNSVEPSFGAQAALIWAMATLSG